MNKTTEHATLKALHAIFRDAGYEADLHSGKEATLDLVRAYIGDMGESKGAAVMEICFVPLMNEENIRLLQFYTTIITGLDKEKLPKILRAINDMNFSCILGAFGIYENAMHLYHRYVIKVESQEPNEISDIAANTANWVLFQIDGCYDQLMQNK